MKENPTPNSLPGLEEDEIKTVRKSKVRSSMAGTAIVSMAIAVGVSAMATACSDLTDCDADVTRYGDPPRTYSDYDVTRYGDTRCD